MIVFAIGVVLYKKAFFNVFGGFPTDQRIAQDAHLHDKISKFSNAITVKKINVVLFDRRIHDTNLTVIHPVKNRDKSFLNKRYPSILDVFVQVEKLPVKRLK